MDKDREHNRYRLQLKQKRNTSGVIGVVWVKSRGKWQVNITINGKTKLIGRYKDFENAVLARYLEEVNNTDCIIKGETCAYNYLKENNLLK